MTFIWLLVISISLLYILLIGFFYIGWLKYKVYKYKKADFSTFVSIVIAARNEENDILNLLVPVGTMLNIPSDYAKKLIILIDKSTYLPIFMEVYDDKGLYEQYKFSQVKINPPFTEADFNENNKNYGFK